MEIKFITPEIVTKPKDDKKGREYISVKTKLDEWYTIYRKDLFHHFVEGQGINVEIRIRGDFKEITGLASDREMLETKPTIKNKKADVVFFLEHLRDEVNAELDALTHTPDNSQQ